MPGDSDYHEEINLKILRSLSQDSSKSFVDIAKELQVSDATIHMRVKRLVASGIIRKFTISVDSAKLGYDHLAFMGVNIRQGAADELTSELASFREVLEVHELHGRFDLLVKIRARSLEEMRNIVVNKIRSMPQVIEVELMPVLRSAKEEPMVDLSEVAGPTDAAAS
ncbi:MAG: Lrp/AsnC family transcriptional regulator [Nitrososphaera sp.]|jgi:Lrp/AsnC family transcriptional regulator for asnA, asnC and gidA